MKAMFIDEPRLEEAFRTGEGVGWDEHHPCLFSGCEQSVAQKIEAFLIFQAVLLLNLMQSWLPSLEGVVGKLKKGARPDGSWLIVEPFANDELEKSESDRASILLSIDNGVHAGVEGAGSGNGAGAQAGEKRLREVVIGGRFSQFRRMAGRR